MRGEVMLNTFFKFELLSVVALSISACSTLIYLQHPETKHVVHCQADPWATEWCARGYERAGYVRMDPFE